jgi:hypothetical protein
MIGEIATADPEIVRGYRALFSEAGRKIPWLSLSTTLDLCFAPRRSATLWSCRRAVRLTLLQHLKA